MANDYAYLDATVDEIELNTKKITELSDGETYTDEQYPTAEAVKSYVASHASQITVDDAMSDTSENPVQNKVVKAAIDSKVSKSGDVMTGQLEVPNLQANYIASTVSIETPEVSGLEPPTLSTQATNKGYVDAIEASCEKTENKTTLLSENSTHTQYPSAKCVWDAIQDALLVDADEPIIPVLELPVTVNLVPIEETYPEPTVNIFDGVFDLTEGQWVSIDFVKDGQSYTEGEQIIALSTQSASFGDRLGFAYSRNNVVLAFINDCAEIDFSSGTISGSGKAIIYNYTDDQTHGTATIREATAAEIADYEGGE